MTQPMTQTMTQRPGHIETDLHTPMQIEKLRCAVLGVEHEAHAAFWSTDGHGVDDIVERLGQCAAQLHKVGVDRHVPACCMPGQVEVDGVCVWPTVRPFEPAAQGDSATASGRGQQAPD